jgi:hypothetical protein
MGAMEALSNHPKLESLCLHQYESYLTERHRETYKAEELRMLGAICPRLETLELDVDASHYFMVSFHNFALTSRRIR